MAREGGGRGDKLVLTLLVAWSVIFMIEPRTLKGRGSFDISRRDTDAITAAPHQALMFVRAPYWMTYPNLSDGDGV